MTTTKHLLECARRCSTELARHIANAQQFGLDQLQPGSSLSNGQRVLLAFDGLRVLIDALERRGDLGKLP